MEKQKVNEAFVITGEPGILALKPELLGLSVPALREAGCPFAELPDGSKVIRASDAVRFAAEMINCIATMQLSLDSNEITTVEDEDEAAEHDGKEAAVDPANGTD